MDEGEKDNWDDIDAGWGDIEGVKESAPKDKTASEPKKKYSRMAEKRPDGEVQSEPPSSDDHSSARPTHQAVEPVAPHASDVDSRPTRQASETETEAETEEDALEEVEGDEPTRPGQDQEDPFAEPIHFEAHTPAKEPTERHTRDTARLRRISDSVEPLASDAEGEAAPADSSEPLVVRSPSTAAPQPSGEPAGTQPKGSRQALIIFAVLVVLAVAAVVAVVVTALG